MAGAGVKKFVTGEVLSDAEVNTYLMDQTVAVFTNADARDAAFGEANEPSLSEGRLCYLQSTKKIQFYNGVSWSDSDQFSIPENGITTAQLKSDVAGEEAVTTAKIRDDAVTAAKLADSSSTDGDRAVTTNHIRNNAITSGKLASGLTLAGTTTLSGTGKIQQLLEKATLSATALTGQQTINIENGAVYYYYTDSSANFQFKITASGSSLNSVMSNHEAITVVVFTAQGTSAKKLSDITIDELSSGVTVRWFGGSAYPSGNASSVDVYTITAIKTGDNTFDVFASQSSFKAA